MLQEFGWSVNQIVVKRNLTLSSCCDESFPFAGADAVELLHAMRREELSSEQLVRYCMNQILKWDGKLNAMISINPDILEKARECDKLRKAGDRRLLLGLPVVVKDNINTKDLPTTLGALALKDGQPKTDAEIVHLLREAGAIILGKASLSEYASSGMTNNSLIGQTYNPYDLTRTPGGSSGGCGAAVAAEYAAAGLGTDGVNSVRSPASANCLVGIRPTKGLISGKGVAPSSDTQDMPGILTRSVQDAALFLAVCALGPDPGIFDSGYGSQIIHQMKTESLAGKKIALLRNNCGTDPEVLSVVKDTIRRMEEAGVQIIEWEDPVLDAERMLRENNVIRYEQKENIERWLSDPENGFSVQSLKQYLDTGLVVKDIESVLQSVLHMENPLEDENYKKRIARIVSDRKYILKKMENENIDAVCYPSQRVPVVVAGNEKGQIARNGIMASCLGFPAVAFPAGFTKRTSTAPLGIPVGMELMGAPMTDWKLLAILHSYEKHNTIRKSPINLQR